MESHPLSLINYMQGTTNKAISQQLHISVRTVEVHRANIMEKMPARSLAVLVQKLMKLS